MDEGRSAYNLVALKIDQGAFAWEDPSDQNVAAFASHVEDNWPDLVGVPVVVPLVRNQEGVLRHLKTVVSVIHC